MDYTGNYVASHHEDNIWIVNQYGDIGRSPDWSAIASALEEALGRFGEIERERGTRWIWKVKPPVKVSVLRSAERMANVALSGFGVDFSIPLLVSEDEEVVEEEDAKEPEVTLKSYKRKSRSRPTRRSMPRMSMVEVKALSIIDLENRLEKLPASRAQKEFGWYLTGMADECTLPIQKILSVLY